MESYHMFQVIVLYFDRMRTASRIIDTFKKQIDGANIF